MLLVALMSVEKVKNKELLLKKENISQTHLVLMVIIF